jgi:hypothetical protein
MGKYTLYKKFENVQVNDNEINEAITAILILKNEWLAEDNFIINYLQSDYNEKFIKNVLKNPIFHKKYKDVELNNKLIDAL